MSDHPRLLSADPEAPFPPADSALREPEGLLAVGGDLSPVRLLRRAQINGFACVMPAPLGEGCYASNARRIE